MARIRHIALRCERQEEVADFYCKTFGMVEVLRHGSAQSEGRIALYLSDGAMNLAILPGGKGLDGIDHFGFQVDDIAAISKAALAHGARRGATSVPQDGRKNEAFITDPADQRIDISARGWDYGGTTTAQVNRLILSENDPAALAAFYRDVFSLHEVADSAGDRVLSDGYIDLAIVPNEAPGSVGTRSGVQYFGFQVDDAAATLEVAIATGGNVTASFLLDPQGQRIDIVQRGLEAVAN